jgi:transposase
VSENAYTLFVGIDVSAASVSVAWQTKDSPPRPAFDIPQTPAGWKALAQRLRKTGHAPAQTLVVVEATSTYWMQLALHLHEQGFRVSVINPLQAHGFARALLKRGKTDAIDAETLAQLAAALQPAAWTPPPPVYEELRQRLVQRDSLLQMRQQEGNRLHALRKRPNVVESVKQRMMTLIAYLNMQIAEIEREIEAVLAQDHEWAESAERLLSISGVGFVTTAWLLVSTLNFTLCENAKQLAAYAGLAPYPHQSGTSVRRRHRIGHAGHGRLRKTLYMAAVTALRFNPMMRDFYQRLKANGKESKIAVCAVARKLLCLAWTLVKKQRMFDPDYTPTLASLPATA